jgi:hypothetical protein
MKEKKKYTEINDDELREWWPCHSVSELTAHFSTTYSRLWRRAVQMGLKKDPDYIHDTYQRSNKNKRHVARGLSKKASERDMRAYALFQKKVRFTTIAKMMGYKSVSSAYASVRRARERVADGTYNMCDYIKIFNTIEL